MWVATGEIVLRPSYRGSSCAGCVGTWRTTGSMERLQEEPTHRHCVGTQCWQGPCWLQLLSECRVWARHPQEWKHTYITLSLGAFAPTCCFGNSLSRMCSVFIFLSSCRQWPITFLSWSRGSEGAKLKQKTWAPSWLSSSPARTSSRYCSNIHPAFPQNHNPPHPTLGRGFPLSFRRGLHRF